ncbi:hypothetical protein SAMN05443634_102291 [Chishuiella changwenlii]|uniref:Uncharacterized protein n=1 Tax=Chishuiella changwenlii TaxID=1434701 RepID=A0A1M6UAW8_9FLAO|nr:hypothetical protein [Chishuiella changwenlii]GGE99311.1 hypothetical protein GCM10010984_16130 [Chishuiella changwenlii]SHK66382.1 hypothetical protein SAMN05443634_102291 [Chishuiella changwenlii]
MKKLILILSIVVLNTSCHSNQAIKNEDKSEQKMFQHRITVKDLENSKPIVVKTDKGYMNVYSVIIYTDNPSELEEKGIAVQSKSTRFVTALIKKEDLEKIYQLKSVKSISLPKMDYLHDDKLN